MNENRLVAGLALAILVPGAVMALGDFRKGKARLMLFSRARSKVETSLAENSRKFWAYSAFNLAVCLMVGVFCVLLFLKPEE
ncbi:hypothetical protein ACLIMP_06080 [Novosphingobium aerophilum]|uniref:hypothetical protein n=1 Tax=Novosphingobium TaxID=165696 RepID=UPI0006C83532|nr:MULTISPECIES: hypothetical protein [unclassified Novosphingobium]KPH65810.1 hypothetical protein ADT71_09805 [Novosphingobium sp. ST904]MPS71312.1 hypothetical protein [Novosphingobium sp.]TCM29104.1 hypothetical protein EDF59_12840 [Novosphingobium sp. ST904]WRT93806.1 hypothetical protein U9J33_04625 [Novosphingobium sp. RL4]